jgi:hypothetical protein
VLTTGYDEPAKCWTAKRRVALIVEILRGDTPVAEAARKHGLTVAELEDRRERFLTGAEVAYVVAPPMKMGRRTGRFSGSSRKPASW